MVHHRLRVPVGALPVEVVHVAVELGQLGYPAADVIPGGVELLALRRRVEHPEVRRRIGAAPRGPLPAVLVVGHVAVHQLFEEPPRPPLPRQVQVLDQKRRHDHSYAVVHETALGQLPHPGVDDRKTCPALFPRLVGLCGLAAIIDLDRVERLVPVPPDTARPLVEHRRVEVAKRELSEISLRAFTAAQVGSQSPGVHRAEFQMCRHAAARIEIRAVAVVGVPVEPVAQERLPLLPGRRLARRQLQFDTVVGDVGQPRLAGHLGRVDPPRRRLRRLRRLAPAVSAPRLIERCEDLVGRAVVLGHPPGRHQIGRAGGDQVDVTQRLSNLLVAASAVGREVLGHMHRIGADLLGQRRDASLRVTARHQQPSVEPFVQIAQRVVEVLHPARPGRRLQRGIQDVAREHVFGAVGSSEQRRMIGQPQIAAKPQHSGHDIDAARDVR